MSKIHPINAWQSEPTSNSIQIVDANISDEKSEQPSITPEKPIIKPKKIHLVCFKMFASLTVLFLISTLITGAFGYIDILRKIKTEINLNSGIWIALGISLILMIIICSFYKYKIIKRFDVAALVYDVIVLTYIWFVFCHYSIFFQIFSADLFFGSLALLIFYSFYFCKLKVHDALGFLVVFIVELILFVPHYFILRNAFDQQNVLITSILGSTASFGILSCAIIYCYKAFDGKENFMQMVKKFNGHFSLVVSYTVILLLYIKVFIVYLFNSCSEICCTTQIECPNCKIEFSPDLKTCPNCNENLDQSTNIQPNNQISTKNQPQTQSQSEI